MVIGKLARGNLRNPSATSKILNGLPAIRVIDYGDTLDPIEHNRLMGKGIDYMYAHLLASVAMADSAVLWTRDIRLGDAAADLSTAYLSEQKRRTIP
jgi:hypothetical protein